MDFQGIPIDVTHEPGSYKLGRDKAGKGWMTRMKAARGIVRGLDGQGRNEIKAWVGDDHKSGRAFVLEQGDDDGFDERKLAIGFKDPVHAAKTVLAHYPEGKHNIRAIREIPAGGLEDWIAGEEAWSETARDHHGRPHEVGGIHATYEGRRINAERFEMPEELAKAHEPMQDGDRWITVHPNGPGTKGNAVLIRPVKGEPGVHRVVGGAGGSLNFLRIHLTKNPEDYKKEALERRTQRRAEEKERRSKMTPEEVAAEKAADAAAKEKRVAAERHFIAQVLGDDSQDGQEVDLFNESEQPDPKAAKAYHRERLRQAFRACKEAERKITLDAEARMASGLDKLGGNVGLNPDAIFTTPSSKGPGYDREISRRAEQNGMTAEALTLAAQEWKEANGIKPKDVPITDPAAPTSEAEAQKAVETHLQTKEIQKAKSEAAKAAVAAALDNAGKLGDLLKARAELRGAYEAAVAAKTGRTFPGGFLATTSEPTPEDKEALVQDLTEGILRGHVKTFLDEVERANPESETLTDAAWGAEEEGMAAPRGAAAWGALHEAGIAIFGQGILDRDVVETLGGEASAQVLAQAIRTRFGPDDQKAILKAVEASHLHEQMTALPEATAEIQKLRAEAAQMGEMILATPRDFAAAAEIHRTKVEALKEAQKVAAATLGRFEARAALVAALQSTPPKEIHVPLGRVSPEKAIQIAAASGLKPGTYDLTHTEGEGLLTIPQEHLDKVTRPVDSQAVAEREIALAIKRGEMDEDGYLPQGFANRSASRYQNELQDPPVFRRKVELPEGATGAHLKAALGRYVGQRWADGHDATQISADLRGTYVRDMIPEGLHGELDALVDELVPTHALVRGADGEPVPEIHNGEIVKNHKGEVVFKRELNPKLALSAVEKLGHAYLDGEGDGNLTLNGQEVDPNHQDFREAIHRTLAEDPRLQASHIAPQDLNDVHRAAIRDWFYREHHKGGAALADAIKSLGPEPPKFDETTGGMSLFEDLGPVENPAWIEWANAKADLEKKMTPDGSSPWGRYVENMGGLAAATAAIQDEMKGRFAEAFHGHYGRLSGMMLQLGTGDVSNYSQHLKATTDPAKAAELEAARKSKQALAQKKGGGKFQSVDFKGKAALAGAASALGMGGGLFGSEELEGLTEEEAPKWERPEPAPGERMTLGARLEAQLAQAMPSAAQAFESKDFRPVKVAEGMHMGGKYAPQQRAIKAIQHLKRLGLFYGAGSGKTSIMMGSTSELVTQGKAKKVIMAVPSIVQGQFGAEAINFLDPNSGIKVHARPGDSWEERLAAYRDPGKHAVVMTHQGFRDDSVRLLAAHMGKTEDEAAAWAMNAAPDELKKGLKEAFQAHQIDFDGFMVDEGHDALNRKGKPDSLLAKIIDAHGHNAAYYVGATGSPVKNDPSEAFDWLHKIDPARYPKSAQSEFLRRYGKDSAVTRRALKAELSRYFHAERVHPGVTAHHQDHEVDLDAEQHQAMDVIDRAAAKLRLGEDPLKWAKELAPQKFAGHPEDEHQAIAEKVKAAVGTFREAAMNRVINVGGSKHKAAAKIIADRLGEGKPVVVFAHHLESVEALQQHLAGLGIPALALTGKDSAKVKAGKLAGFQGAQPTHQVIILSDAGATGANLQRGKVLIHMDQPMTYKTHEQRTARIHRLGQTEDVEVINLLANHEHDKKARKRVSRKQELAEIYQSKEGYLDDSGLAESLRHIRAGMAAGVAA